MAATLRESVRTGAEFAVGRLRRSLLITPGDDEKLMRKASQSPTDVAIAEWEDGVYNSRKQAAREITGRCYVEFDWGHRERVVRINSLDNPHSVDDLDAVVAIGADAVMLPKVYSADDVRNAAAQLEAAERRHGRPEGSVLIWTMMETAKSIINADDIAVAHPRMTAVLFGGGDLGADLKVKKLSLGANRKFGPIRYEYLYGYSRVITAARAAGIDPCIMGYTTYTDLDGTRLDAEFSAQMGFSGGLALSARQLPVINEAFSPNAEELEWADSVIRDFEGANRDDRTVFVVDAEMADGPYVRSARNLRDIQRRIDARNEPAAANAC